MPSHVRPRRSGVRSEQKPAVRAERTVAGRSVRPSPTVWAYAYQIVPPQTKSRLRAVRALLDKEHVAAQLGSRAWAGRLILGAQMTRILIVSDSLEWSREVNQRLEAELNQLKVDFSVTEPVEVPGSGAPASP
jgi:hypothetical protein